MLNMLGVLYGTPKTASCGGTGRCGSLKTKILIFVKVLGACFPIVMLLMLSGVVSVQWHGFGVDSGGSVYVGTGREIRVYAEGVPVRSVDIPDFQSYYFTVQNDTIVLATPGRRYVTDLDGNILDAQDDGSGAAYAELQKLRSVRGQDGAAYRAKTLLRHTVVKEDGTAVYQMALADFAARLLWLLSPVCFCVAVIDEMRKQKRRKQAPAA